MATTRLEVLTLALLFGVYPVFSGTPLIKSTDGGRTWIDIDPGLPHQGIVDLQIASNGSRLYALTITDSRSGALWPALARRDYSVLSSSDGGRSWQELEPLRAKNVWLATMAVAPSDRETLYVAFGRTNSETGDLGREHAILKTTDGGRTAVELRTVDNLLLRESGRQFGLCSQFIYLPQVATAFLAVHPAIPTRLFWGVECAVEYDGIHPGFIASADGGVNWQLSWKIGPKQLVADPDDPATLYAKHQETYDRTRGHLAKSSDGGNEWPVKLSDVFSFALNPRDPSVLLASKEDGSLWRSSDRAETWEQLGNWLPFDRLIFHRAKSSVVLAQAPEYEGDIFKSEDGGATWTVVHTGMHGFSFVFDPNDAGTIYGISMKRLEPRFRAPYVRNLAGRSALTAGSIFSIYGEDLADAIVRINGQPVRLLFSSPGQINAQIPASLEAAEATVEIKQATGVDRQSIALSPVAPVILADSSGLPRLYHLDSGRPVTAAEPARNGRWIVAHCTGLRDGTPLSLQLWPADSNASPSQIKFVSPVPGRDGVYQVAIDLSPALAPGPYILRFSRGQNFARLEVH